MNLVENQAYLGYTYLHDKSKLKEDNWWKSNQPLSMPNMVFGPLASLCCFKLKYSSWFGLWYQWVWVTIFIVKIHPLSGFIKISSIEKSSRMKKLEIQTPLGYNANALGGGCLFDVSFFFFFFFLLRKRSWTPISYVHAHTPTF